MNIGALSYTCLSFQWTYYPNGKPVSVNVVLSGIRSDDGRMLMLNEGDMPQAKEEIDQMAIRRVEILRHLPLAVAQFDSSGCLMEQNPESMNMFGGSNSKGPGLVDRFVDKSAGQQALQAILESEDNFRLDAELHTMEQGTRWFAIKARRSKDPVTGGTVILYSARDITDVRQAKKEADLATLQKSEFLAVMAHEIRTPLHQVVGFIELLERTQLTSQQTDYLRFLESSANSLMVTVNDLLDYTKLEAGKMKLESIPFKVRDVVDGSLMAIRPKTEGKELELTSSVRDTVPARIVGDPTRLRQLLLNLLHNAVKFTNTGKISVDVRRLEKRPGKPILRFEVRDTGVGIGKEKLGVIFSKYQQADESVPRNYGGTGLGLAICKQLVELMDGSIGVDSEAGKGSVFWFQLPFGTKTKNTPKTNVLSELCAPSEVSLNVLVADDNLINQKLAAALLKRLGHSCTIVENGAEAVKEAKSGFYSLVLMDVQMPVMGGMEATQKIRESFSLAELPIVGLTADYVTQDLGKYKKVGMNDCIGKPVRLEHLRETIYNAYRGSRACVE